MTVHVFTTHAKPPRAVHPGSLVDCVNIRTKRLELQQRSRFNRLLYNRGRYPIDLKRLAQLLAYRNGKLDPAGQLADLPDTLRELILHMIQLDPGDA